MDEPTQSEMGLYRYVIPMEHQIINYLGHKLMTIAQKERDQEKIVKPERVKTKTLKFKILPSPEKSIVNSGKHRSKVQYM